MPESTKYAIKISIADSKEERDRISARLRQIALTCGYKGRYGGNLSELMKRLGSLEEEDRYAVGLLLKRFLKKNPRDRVQSD